MRPIFIFGGDGGSRAFLSALLAAHDACVETPQFTTRYLKAARGSLFFDEATFSAAPEFSLDAFSEPQAASPEAVGQRVAAYACDHGSIDAAVWLEHVNVLELARLDATFSEARFLHLVRDGRASTAALWQEPGEPRRPLRASRSWQETTLRGLEAETTLGKDRCLHVSYETLLSDLGTGLDTLARFIGLPPEGFRIARSVLYKDYDPHLYSWRTQLTLHEIKLFETVSGALLTDLGYGLEAPGSGLPARPDVWHRAGRPPLRPNRSVSSPSPTAQDRRERWRS